jgi:hypothetical protein
MIYSVTYTIRQRVWQFPADKFCRYEKSDEAWARLLGFGREIEVLKTISVPRAICIGVREGQMQFQSLGSQSTYGFC